MRGGSTVWVEAPGGGRELVVPRGLRAGETFHARFARDPLAAPETREETSHARCDSHMRHGWRCHAVRCKRDVFKSMRILGAT